MTHRPMAAGVALDPVRDAALIGEIIQMALSDHVGFAEIRAVHGLGPDQVKALMRSQLSPGSYRCWRRRVRQFADRRACYK
ncbi:DUF2805 domain-containing protein [Aquabacterium sp.]|uniref:DUF2805 domain-containing protein n=1 Tax=Aquabacterium sp. TaxID=1872578 RepID=UPI0024876CB2|nr:DUF2805 domain-containing protein [Aquabacterium sp.]MDI1349490.1 DUF2805 domain-containing protein [Aquabacterium sp.]